MPPLGSLKVFVTAAESSSFSSAARKLGRTPAAVSKSIGLLEEQLNIRLFNRTTRQLQLTTDGRAFYETTRHALHTFDDAVEQLSASRGEPSGLIRITMTPSFGRLYVLPLLGNFIGQYRQVNLDLAFRDSAHASAETDFDIGIQRGALKHVRYMSKKLCSLPFILVASPAYLARAGTPRTPADLRDHTCLNVRYSSGSTLLWRMTTRSSAPARRYVHHPKDRVVFTEQLDSVVDAAMHGLGIAPVAATSVIPQLRDGTLRVVLPEWRINDSIDMFILYPRSRQLPARIRLLAEFLVVKLRSNADLRFTADGI
jgi:LysR family transcriptional regulator, transcriptional activator for dmlA